MQILNKGRKLLCINLDTFKPNGTRDSLYIEPRKKSRELSEEEFKSKEISALLKSKKYKIKVVGG